MPHPLHDILLRLLDSEQYAFDETALAYWPPGSWPQGEDDAGSKPNNPTSERDLSSPTYWLV